MKGAPRLSSVLGALGCLTVLSAVVAAVLDADPYLDSLVQGALALALGVVLVAVAVRVSRYEWDDRSWRAVGWVGLFLLVAAAELVWVGVVSELVGTAQLHFAVLTTLSTGLTAGGAVAWYDLRREARHREYVDSQESYREVFDSVSDGILVHDPETGRILDANSSAERIYGYLVEELREMVVADFAAVQAGYDQSRALENIQRALEEGETTFEWLNVSPDGERYWVEVTLGPAVIGGEQRVLAAVRDIDDRKQREWELRLKDRALDEAGDAIAIAEADEDMSIVYVNDAFLETTGYDRDAVLGRPFQFIQGSDTAAGQAADLRRAVEAGERASLELLNYRADGTPFWNEVSVTPVHDADGSLTHFLSVQRDITERKRRERAFSVINRVLRHNLRNELNVVVGNARRLEERNEGGNAAIAARVAETADDLAGLGEKARELESAVTSDVTLHPTGIGDTVRTVADDLRGSFPDATVTADVADRGMAMATSHVERALYELGENALEHGGSTVAFTVDCDGDDVVVRVDDDGPGLPKMERDVLRAGRETPLQHGSGVGLWLVNWVVTDVGGHLDVTVDDGTAVTVTLPAADADGAGQQSAISVD